jgi:hypothetical protein
MVKQLKLKFGVSGAIVKGQKKALPLQSLFQNLTNLNLNL